MSDEQPRKKMRKGTHSCTECEFQILTNIVIALLSFSAYWISGRRRKKSCIPHPTSTGACTECFSRGVLCREQARKTLQPSQNSKQNLRQRVTELESALLNISNKLGPAPSETEANGVAAETLTQLRSDLLPPTPGSLISETSSHECFDSAPVLSLFDNAILSRRPDSHDVQGEPSNIPHYGTVEGRVGRAKTENIQQILLSLFPTQQRLEVLLDASHDWWNGWQHMFPEIFGLRPNCTIYDFVIEARSSGSVQKISKALLCVAVGLQETSIIYDANYNVASAQDCTEKYLSVVEDLVLSKDDLAGTIDGIECMLLHAKHDSNNGRVRRAWVTFRRAISFAQLQGLHLQVNNHSAENIIRKQSIWKALYQGDRFLSLLLGLPYSVSDIRFEPTYENGVTSNDINAQPTGETFLFRLANIVGHIIDRNQDASSNNALTVTVKIEGELIDLASTMPSNWWALDPISPRDVASQLYSRYIPRFWHHQARTLLHLPFMLKATTDPRYEYNKLAALESARGMLDLYGIIRPAAGFTSLVCRIMDFQAFTAAMVLVLNTLGLPETSPMGDTRQTDADRASVSIATEILQKASTETGGQVASQAARALELFGRDRAFQGASKVAVPYFGTVSFGPGKSFAHNVQPEKKQTSAQPQRILSPSEGSLSVSPQSQDQWSVQNSFLAMPSDFNFGPYSAQQPQDLSMDDIDLSNVNFDIDQDWSWFWNNTELS